MGHALAGLQVRGPVGDNDVFRRDKLRGLTLQVGVVVDLLERVTGQSKAPQHALMLRAVLHHALGQLVVHIYLHALGRILLLRRFLADDLRLDRPRCREGLHHGLCLELHQGFRKQWVVDTARAGPRFRPLLDLHTQKLQTVDVGLYPVLAGADVVLELAQQVTSEGLKDLVVHVLG